MQSLGKLAPSYRVLPVAGSEGRAAAKGWAGVLLPQAALGWRHGAFLHPAVLSGGDSTLHSGRSGQPRHTRGD